MGQQPLTLASDAGSRSTVCEAVKRPDVTALARGGPHDGAEPLRGGPLGPRASKTLPSASRSPWRSSLGFCWVMTVPPDVSLGLLGAIERRDTGVRPSLDPAGDEDADEDQWDIERQDRPRKPHVGSRQQAVDPLGTLPRPVTLVFRGNLRGQVVWL